MFVLENESVGEGIEDDCTAGARVKIWFPCSGDIVYAIIAASQTIEKGDVLVSAGGGLSANVTAVTQKHVGSIVGIAREDVKVAVGETKNCLIQVK